MPRLVLGTAALLAASVNLLGAQVPDAVVPVDSVIVEPSAVAAVAAQPAGADPLPISPRGAFIRNMIIPGWGHAPFETYTRGGLYFAGWSANWFMIFRNQVRLTEARNRLDLRRSQIADALIAAAPDPDSMRIVLATTDVLDTAVRGDALGSDLRDLVESREQQREDWIAWSIFWLLASGIDAYVTAHLADFPTGVDIESNADRSVSIRLDIPFPQRRP